MSLRTPPILLADRIGIFIFAYSSSKSFSLYRERQATLQSSYQRTSAMLISQRKSKCSHKPSSAPRLHSVSVGAKQVPLAPSTPSYVFRLPGIIKLWRLPLRSAPVGAKQASPGRLTPCHGYYASARITMFFSISFIFSQL